MKYYLNLRKPSGERLELVDAVQDDAFKERVQDAKKALGLLPDDELVEKANAIRQEMNGTAPNPDLNARVQDAKDAIHGTQDAEVAKRVEQAKTDLYGSK